MPRNTAPRAAPPITPALQSLADAHHAKFGIHPEWYLQLLAETKAKRAARPASAKSQWEAKLLGDLVAAGLPEPVTQYKWCHGRRFAADFAYPDARILIEVQGGVFQGGGGRHNRGVGYEADRAKINEAQLLGWHVLEFGTSQVRDGTAAQTIARALRLWLPASL